VQHYVKAWQLMLSVLLAMPMMTGLLLLTSPHVLSFRGASGIAAMMWMLVTWFLLVEEKRFSWGYWLGLILLVLFLAKAGIEGMILLSPNGNHFAGFHVAWLLQAYGALLGLAFFNGLHQIHMTSRGKNPHYRGPYATRPKRYRQPSR